MRRRWGAFVGFGACLAVLLASVAGVSALALRLDRSEREARRQAALEENVRLALWRMDSQLAPLLFQENARPPAAYRDPFPAPELVAFHFELHPDGQVTTPQAASGAPAAVLAADLEAVLPTLADGSLAAATTSAKARAPAGADVQRAKSAGEWQSRAESAELAWGYGVANQALFVQEGGLDLPPGPPEAMQPVWVGERLLLVRRVPDPRGTRVQGAALDRESLEARLLAVVTDLLPEAELAPAMTADGGADEARALASLPIRIVPGAAPAVAGETSAVIWVLATAWISFFVAAAAVVLLLAGIVGLSERRAAFVSAVTHELRTPLTTLQTYSEMLADERLPGAEQRIDYARTLHREALRLGHLVDNVLAYSRIERGSEGARRDRLDAARVLERCRDRLDPRAEQAGAALEIRAPEGLGFLGDEAAVERILFNLVDNACKHGGRNGASERSPRIEIVAAAEGERVAIRVRDGGPGVPTDVRAHLFRAFSRSAERAARAAPGVGLGLALSRRLARAMGGDLVLEEEGSGEGDGAVFALFLPGLETSEPEPRG